MGSQANHIQWNNNCTTNQANQPWLDQYGFKLPDEELKSISKNWCPEIWKRYLQSLEGQLSESQLHPREYDDKSESMEDGCFEFTAAHSSDALSATIKEVLAKLPVKQQQVVELIFWEGKSERQIAEIMRISRSSVRDIKSRALKRLAKILRTPTTTSPLMRGEISPLIIERGTHEVDSTLASDRLAEAG